jgi:N-acetyl-anhydromuramyl-L-alanine amidase AmpD
MENLEMPKGKRKINKIYIHHSASPRATTTREDIYKWHVVQNGWKDIGYHYMINNMDMVEIGRAENTTGAHVKNDNATSIGICVFGNYETEVPTAKQIEVLKDLVNGLLAKHSLTWQDVYGHRDGGATACPGKNLYAVLQQIKQSYC